MNWLSFILVAAAVGALLYSTFIMMVRVMGS